MAITVKENSVGAWAFLIGVVIAIVIGIFTYLIPVPSVSTYSSQIYGVLVLLGLFVGFSIKMANKDSQTFLIAGAILVVVSRFGIDSVKGSLIGIGVGEIVSAIFVALLALFVPATIIVALKTVFSMAKV